MPRTYQQNKIIKDERKQEILNRSLELFASSDFNKLTMDDIANFIPCSHGLLYHYFSNKKELVQSLRKICYENVSNIYATYEVDNTSLLDTLMNAINVAVSMAYSKDKKIILSIYMFSISELDAAHNEEKTFLDKKEISSLIKDFYKSSHLKNPTIAKQKFYSSVYSFLASISGLALANLKYKNLYKHPLNANYFYEAFFKNSLDLQ